MLTRAQTLNINNPLKDNFPDFLPGNDAAYKGYTGPSLSTNEGQTPKLIFKSYVNLKRLKKEISRYRWPFIDQAKYM